MQNFKEKIKSISHAKNGFYYIKVKIKPGAHENCIREIMSDQTIKIDIKAPAVENKANTELIKFLAKYFITSNNNVKITRGLTSKNKLIKIII